MQTFLFQTGVQGAIIALIWVLVARDASRLRDRHGTTPANLSPFAWGALCGLTWIALIPYLRRRNSVSEATLPGRERNVMWWWVGLAGAALVWSAINGYQDDANNAAQHGLLAGIFVICALVAWSRDRVAGDAQPQPSKPV